MTLVCDVSVCFKNLLRIKNCLCLLKKLIQLSDDKISSSEQPKIYRTKKSSDNCNWKENTKPEAESTTFFRSIKLCADEKLFWTTEDTNSKVQNQKTTFDRLEHSAKNGCTSSWEFAIWAPLDEDMAFWSFLCFVPKLRFHQNYLFLITKFPK